MNANALANRLNSLSVQRPITVLGAVVIDVIADAYSLPWRGCDIELQQQSVNIGGCAFNVALALKRLGLETQNVLPLGQGVWADIIRNSLTQRGMRSAIETDEGDNGWCLALVEPDGERTFMSFSGVENQWRASWLDNLVVQPQSLVYLAGYQLASPRGEVLVDWLENLSQVTPFIDFGPRIADIPEAMMSRIMALKPIVSLNRQEAEIAARALGVHNEVQSLGAAWLAHYGSPLIVRQDSEGAWFFDEKAQGCAAPFSASVVDTIGAGDSHAGGAIAGLSAGWSLAESVTLGNAVASFVVSHRGGDCAPTVDELTARLKLANEGV
ncbi:5-dehydro-2-deoxygluconokinase [Leminorella richardii]|uniref:5-dehydro-2-deoxygluconokinase n=1 Tax=Leminorella richardii TaxID=158841 RepID=A0A2X4U7X4_9GAMM|nr:PfkB family carbohydrate kinase [Leminorella richardii]SQI35061.1 5-dehydro-2-deoxygluconokinase [Leminorella richardii]